MAVVWRCLLIVRQPETSEDLPRRPSVGLRHYIPLFFLAPSMLLMVHAWNHKGPPAPRVFIEVDTGGFRFPGDAHLEVELDSGERAPVEGGQATFATPPAGPIRVTLQLYRADDGRRVVVGEPTVFTIAESAPSTRFALPVSAAACARALEILRAPR